MKKAALIMLLTLWAQTGNAELIESWIHAFESNYKPTVSWDPLTTDGTTLCTNCGIDWQLVRMPQRLKVDGGYYPASEATKPTTDCPSTRGNLKISIPGSGLYAVRIRSCPETEAGPDMDKCSTWVESLNPEAKLDCNGKQGAWAIYTYPAAPTGGGVSGGNGGGSATEMQVATPPDEAFFFTEGGTFDGTTASAIIHADQKYLNQGTGRWQVNFTASKLVPTQFMVSRDADGQAESGHIGIGLKDDRVYVRMQTTTDELELESPAMIQAGTAYAVTLSFGSRGIALFVNDQLVASDANFAGNSSGNSEPLVIGAGSWNSTPGTADKLSDAFNGSVMLGVLNSQADF